MPKIGPKKSYKLLILLGFLVHFMVYKYGILWDYRGRGRKCPTDSLHCSIVYEENKMTTYTHTFGVEWEVAFDNSFNRSTLRSAFDAAGCHAVKIIGDPSIPVKYPEEEHRSHSTAEIVFPPMADCDAAWDIYSKVSAILEDFGVYDPNHVRHPRNKSAGMHVHVSTCAISSEHTAETYTDASLRSMANSRGYLNGDEWFGPQLCSLAVKDIALRYYENQPTINRMLPRSRRDAYYCNQISERAAERIKQADTIGQIRSAIGQGKYHVINLNTVTDEAGTIEFRQGQCTWSMEKTREWVRLLLSLVYSTRETRVKEGNSVTMTTPECGDNAFRRGTRIAVQYDLMRTQRGATTREIINAMGGTEQDVRRRVSELRDRFEDAAIVTHTQQANGGSYGDGTDMTRYQVLETYQVGTPDEMVPENRRGPSTIYATLSDDQFEYWQNRIAQLR